MPAIPELRRLRQEDGCKFTANLGYSALSITPTMGGKGKRGRRGERERREEREGNTQRLRPYVCLSLNCPLLFYFETDLLSN